MVVTMTLFYTHEFIDLLLNPFEPLFKNNKVIEKSMVNKTTNDNQNVIKDKHNKLVGIEQRHRHHHKKTKEQNKDLVSSSTAIGDLKKESSSTTKKEGIKFKSSRSIAIPKSASDSYLKEREQTPSPPDRSMTSKLVNSITNYIPKVVDTPLFYSSTLSSSSSSGESNTQNMDPMNDHAMEDNEKVEDPSTNNDNSTVIIRKYKEKSAVEKSDIASKKNLKLKNKKLRAKSKPSHVSSLRKEILKRNFQHHENDKNDITSNKRIKLDDKANDKHHHHHHSSSPSSASTPVQKSHNHSHNRQEKEGNITSSSSSHDSKKSSSSFDFLSSSHPKTSIHSSSDKNSKNKKDNSSKSKILKKITSTSSLDSYFQNFSPSSRPNMPVGIALKKEQGIITKHGVIPFKNDKSKPIDTIHHEIPVLTGNTANLIQSFLSMNHGNDDKKVNPSTSTLNSIDKYINNNNTSKKPKGNLNLVFIYIFYFVKFNR